MAENLLDDELERSGALILASEDWGKGYGKDPETHAKLIRTEQRLETKLRRYFRELSERVNGYINWYAYESKLQQVQAATLDDFTVSVIVNEVGLGFEDGLLLNVVFEEVANALYLGALSSETIYARPIGITPTVDLIQKAAKEQVAELVGKRVDKDGIIVDNPKAKYRITDTTRKEIRQSVSTSLSLGETRDEAIARLQKTIKNPKRAAIIADTESVNAYQRGVYEYGLASGAVGKEWETVGAIDGCADFAREGIVKLDHLYGGRWLKPTKHPFCRCSLRLVYPEELE